MLAEKAASLSITSTSSINGAISLNPPVTQAGATTSVAIKAAIRNSGNIAITTTVRLSVILQGEATPVYTNEQNITDLPVNNVIELDLGSFSPQTGGNYTVTLQSIDRNISGTISKTLYAGPYAKGIFTVAPTMALPGDVRVTGKIHLEGVGAQTTQTQDPLVPIIREAMQKGVNYEQGQVMWWHNTYRCNGCHIQSQALVGLELSRGKVTVDDTVTRTLFDAFRGWQLPDGSIDGHPQYWYYIRTMTQLGLWAIASWHDQNEAKPYIIKAADYLLTTQNSDGSWSGDYPYGWWGEGVSSTAITMMGVAQSYILSNDTKYLAPLTKATQYMVAAGRVATSNNMAMAHQVMGLEAVLNIIQDTNLKAQAQSTIDSAIQSLKSNQRPDGGWGRYTWYGSDSMVTAQVLYASLKAGVPGDDPVIRKAIQFLLNTQSPDGSWYSQNGILSTRLAATTWVIISLPIALERVGGIDVEAHLKLPENITLNSSIPLPPSQVGSDYTWKILGVDETGKDINLDMTLKGLSLGEARKVAQEAYLTFENSFTKEIVRYDIEIPSVLGDDFVGMSLSLDNTTYPASTNVNSTTTITNSSPAAKDLFVSWNIEDSQGTVVAELPQVFVPLTSGEVKNLTAVWNSGATIAGDYKVHAILKQGTTVIDDMAVSFTIIPSKSLNSKLTTDKTSYNPNEKALITSTITSQSPNYIFENLTARIDITDNLGQKLFTETKTIPILPQGAITEIKTYWNTGSNNHGNYLAALTVTSSAGEVLSTTQATFKILSTASTGAGLKGTITASPDPVYQGREETFAYTATNTGNADLQNAALKILIVDPDTQALKTTLSTTVNIQKGATISGNLTTSTLSLTPRIYMAILQAEIMGNAKTLASTTFEVLPGLEITKTSPDYGRVLIWINDGCEKDKDEGSGVSGQEDKETSSESKDDENNKGEEGDDNEDDDKKECIRQDLIENALKEIGVTYNLVIGKKDFEKEMRNNYYTDCLILGDYNPLEDHYGEELRERVFSGKGLITSPWTGEDETKDILGIKTDGKLSEKRNIIEFTHNDIFPQQTFNSSGKAVKIKEYNSEQVLAWMKDRKEKSENKKEGNLENNGSEKYPAVIKTEYGDGKAIYFAFDLGLSAREENYSQFVEIMRSSLSYVHKMQEIQQFHPYDLVPVNTEIKSLGAIFDLKLTETYSTEIKLIDPSTGQWIINNPWTKEIHIDANEIMNIELFALMPDTKGKYTLTSDVSYSEEGIWKPYQTLTLDINIERDTHDLINDVLYKLDTLYPSVDEEQEDVKEARKYIEKVRDRIINNKKDIDKNIHDTLEAIEAIMEITSVDTKDIRLDMDRLLGIYGEMEYLSVNGVK